MNANRRYQGLVRTLFVFGLYGVLSILLDLDHLLTLLTEGRMGRPAHIGGFVVAWLVCVVGYAFVLRLLYKSLGLIKKKEL